MKLLDRLCAVAGAAAAVALAMIGVVITAQIVARLLGRQIPAADDFAAWSMAASAFLALPYAMRHGEHIRVTLVLQRLPLRAARVLDTVSSAIGFGLAAWAAWNAAVFVYDSWQYDEVAQGMLALPMWIPQLCMPIGLTLLAALLAERLVRLLRGLDPTPGGGPVAATE